MNWPRYPDLVCDRQSATLGALLICSQSGLRQADVCCLAISGPLGRVAGICSDLWLFYGSYVLFVRVNFYFKISYTMRVKVPLIINHIRKVLLVVAHGIITIITRKPRSWAFFGSDRSSRCHNVRLSVRQNMLKSSLELSIFIFLGQRTIREH